MEPMYGADPKLHEASTKTHIFTRTISILYPYGLPTTVNLNVFLTEPTLLFYMLLLRI